MNIVTKVLMMAGSPVLMAMTVFTSAGAQQKPWSPPQISVANTRDVPVVVYLDRGEFEARLGTVPAHQKVQMDLPKYVEDGDEIQIIVHPEGGIDLSSGDRTVHFGKVMEVLVPENNTGYEPPPPPATIPNPGPETTTLTVENPRPIPVTVFLEHGEFDTRIGTVPPNKELTLMIPEEVVDQQTEVEVFIHPEGHPDLASQSFELKRGSHLFVKVPVR